MHYLIYVFFAFVGTGPRDRYPTVTHEIRIPAAADSTQMVRYDPPGLNEAVRRTIAPAAKPSFKYRW